MHKCKMSIFATRNHTLLVIVSVLSHSKQEKCEMGALQFYLDSSHWGLALDLLRDYCDNSQLHFKLFHCLLDKFNKVREELTAVELHCMIAAICTHLRLSLQIVCFNFRKKF